MSKQYDDYLTKHRDNVMKGYAWLKTNLSHVLTGSSDLSQQILMHDKSKFDREEYDAYDAYFYGEKTPEVEENFQKAWLRHIHLNPHHWQYWVLINDDPGEGEVLIEMPCNYIIEMICDWWAFSWAKGDLSEIFAWYEEHSSYIRLASETRKIVEDILWELRGRLGYNTLAHHGIKGQKWGVRNGPPYPLDKADKRNKMIEDAIDSGQVSKTINENKQKRHTQADHSPGRSYIYGDTEYAQDIVDKYYGKGEALVDDNDNWLRKERIDCDDAIGVYVDKDGNETETRCAMIVYSKTGSHVYPRKEEENESD